MAPADIGDRLRSIPPGTAVAIKLDPREYADHYFAVLNATLRDVGSETDAHTIYVTVTNPAAFVQTGSWKTASHCGSIATSSIWLWPGGRAGRSHISVGGYAFHDKTTVQIMVPPSATHCSGSKSSSEDTHSSFPLVSTFLVGSLPA